MSHRPRLLSVLLLAACPSAPTAATDTAPSSTTSGDTDTSSSATGEPTTGTTAPTPDLPPPCPVGSLGCACTQGGSCDPGLVCEGVTCVEGCAVGSLGCSCTQGGGCDSGLKCDDDACVPDPPVSPPCIPNAGAQSLCCGNNILDPLEDCDLGPYGLDDHGECTTLCKLATCGDGLRYDPDEACDGEEWCAPDCTFITCGDGVVDTWEWCEKSRPDDPECTDLCTDARKIIFVTSEHYKGGEIGGLAGGDEKCQTLADAAGLAGEFKVWLAVLEGDVGITPMSRFSWFKGPYVDVNGVEIAPTWSEIYRTDHPAPHVDELGMMVSHSEVMFVYPPETHLMAWATGIASVEGDVEDHRTCGKWDNTTQTGSVAMIDPSWMGANTQYQGTFWAAANAKCDLRAPIICVEQ